MVDLSYGCLEVTFSLPPVLPKPQVSCLRSVAGMEGMDLNSVTRMLATALQLQLGSSVLSQLQALKPPSLQLQFLLSRPILWARLFYHRAFKSSSLSLALWSLLEFFCLNPLQSHTSPELRTLSLISRFLMHSFCLFTLTSCGESHTEIPGFGRASLLGWLRNGMKRETKSTVHSSPHYCQQSFTQSLPQQVPLGVCRAQFLFRHPSSSK